jgi:hypothetical protein
MEFFRADINFKEMIPDIIEIAALWRMKLGEGDIKRMNYKWLD